jgi:hypothetical protein
MWFYEGHQYDQIYKLTDVHEIRIKMYYWLLNTNLPYYGNHASQVESTLSLDAAPQKINNAIKMNAFCQQWKHGFLFVT